MRKVNQYKWAVWPALLAGAMLAAGCSTTGSKASDNAQGVSFPNPSHSSVPEGLFVNLENLRKVSPGMTKKQLYALIGHPRFDEGVIGVRKWNYIFNFRKSDGSGDYFSCQYQIIFNKQDLAEQFYWKPEACKAVLEMHHAAPKPAPVVMPAQPIRLSSDAMFGFDSAKLTDQGHQQLDGLLQQVRSASAVENIDVVGYTDRIGSDSYNMKLSKKRAEAVRDYLVQGGVPADAIQVEGRGKADPVVQCPKQARAKLIACLAPNRRVELSGIAKPAH
ncbi:OmpA family protein [Rhodanobacter glycinis]|jgi:outer membrane protein OmpA-like peptidoglycan-associated protein|uniref:OmpA family protein n=1 Tax=Rhodanobacter glycinis TaxID=582702 RepID=A0A5B9E6G5_9GAMM|nr:OmpA family protein [Rhodanobacter glycinis]QEE25857.1 OmpA family protein [Rhodanobacter glycinis]